MTHDNGRRAPSRRDFFVMGAGIFAVSTLGLSLARRQLVRRTVPVMGTLAELAVVCRDERTGHAAIDAAVSELRTVDRLMSRFSTSSDIGRANAGAFHGPVVVDAATALVVTEALRWAYAEDSVFDPAIGRANALWDVSRRLTPPDARAVERLAGRGLYRSVEVSRRSGSPVLSYANADVALDLGGIAKGFAVDRAVTALRSWGITDGLVNAGGDLYALGSSADGDPWTVGIRAPDTGRGLAGTVTLTDRAIATSGDYEQYFEHDGRRYHHLLDPNTAAPRASSARSLTVAADCCMTADAAATAVFGLDVRRAAAVLARVAPDSRITG
jgi:FAD:protein FMN transferase